MTALIIITLTIVIALVDHHRTTNRIKNHRPDARQWCNHQSEQYSKLKELQYKQY